MRLAIDVSRHKELLTKAIAGILLLLLKHFKSSHVYLVCHSTPLHSTPFCSTHCSCVRSQAECLAQNLVFANCIPLILKFLNQNLAAFVLLNNKYAHELNARRSFVFNSHTRYLVAPHHSQHPSSRLPALCHLPQREPRAHC